MREHQPLLLSNEQRALVSGLIDTNDYQPTTDVYMGIDWADRAHTTLQASYYIGACWLDSNTALEVVPKVKNLDYMQMFTRCFENRDPELQEEFQNIYKIDFDSPLIDVKSQDIRLSPILIVHFLKLLEQLMSRGLKCNYIQREETMYGKTKGRILLTQTIHRQMASGRRDINICEYQEYCEDCTENRILKKALLYTIQYLKNNSVSSSRDLLQIAHRCLPLFVGVSDTISAHTIQHFRINPLYREYAATLKIAKLLLRRFDYCIDNAADAQFDRKTPAFWINMPILFELYVFAELKRAYGNIWYQRAYAYNRIDFCRPSEKLIMDTKYSPKWQDSGVVTENVRQLSGYARIASLRQQVGADDKEMLPCMIIYPSPDGIEHFTAPLIMNESRLEKVQHYDEFYKLGVKLPTI